SVMYGPREDGWPSAAGSYGIVPAASRRCACRGTCPHRPQHQTPRSAGCEGCLRCSCCCVVRRRARRDGRCAATRSASKGQPPPALQGARRQRLVRATRRRESADDPALASLVSNAPRYVKSYATGPRGEAQVVFDGVAIERAITAAGRSVWDRERPFTLVV